MLTAQVAKLQLTSEEASAFDQLLSSWNDDFPGTGNVVDAAVWPDQIKCTEVSSYCRKQLPDALDEMDNWHFSDSPYNPDHLQLNDVQLGEGQRDPSSYWMLQRAMATFNKTKTRWAFNLMLRFAIHVIGDVHQPLHSAQGYFNDTTYGNHTDGDLGGNLIPIIAQNGAHMNLHAYWDSAALQFELNWPYTSDQMAALKQNASELISKFPRSSLPMYRAQDLSDCFGSGDPNCANAFWRWINESYTDAVKYAYGNGLHADQELPAEYVAAAINISQRQIVLGGYRLADVLKAIYPKLPPATTGSPGPLLPAGVYGGELTVVLGVICGFLFLVVVALIGQIVCLRRRLGKRGLLPGAQEIRLAGSP